MTSTDCATLQPDAPLPDRKIPSVQETHQLISRFLPEFLRLAEPDSAARMKLETCTILPGADDGATGILFAQVSSHSEEGVTVIVAIEPEALPPAEIARKLGSVLIQSELTYGNPVLLAVLHLSGGRPGLHLESAQIGTYRDLECVRLFFTAWGLAGSRADYYLQRPEPLAWAWRRACRQPRRPSKRFSRPHGCASGRLRFPRTTAALFFAFSLLIDQLPSPSHPY